MKKLAIALLCLALCLPTVVLGESFAVTDAAGSGSAAFETALSALNAGSLLDAVNGFAKLGAEEDAAHYAQYANALLFLQRDEPDEAAQLWAGLPGFLDSAYQQAKAEALQAHRYVQNGKFGFVNATGEWIVLPEYDWAERVFRAESAKQYERNDAAAESATPCLVAEVFTGTTQTTKTDTEPQTGKYGLVRTDGTLAVPVEYQSVLWAVNGVAAVTDGQSCTLYDLAQGKPIGDAYEAVGTYAEGLIPVKQSGLWGYYSPASGKLLGNGCAWESALPFSEGYAGVSADGQYGFIDQNGKTAVALQYTGVTSFSDGLAGVRIGKKWGFINPQGTLVIKRGYTEVGSFAFGACPVKRGTAWGVIDAQGNVILRIKYSEITNFDPIYHRAWIRQNKLWGLVSASGAIAMKPTWSSRDDFNGNTLCRVGYQNKFGFVDANGKTRILNVYDEASSFRADYAAVRGKDGKISYIDKSNKGFSLDTDVPVECRCGFIEGRVITATTVPAPTVTPAADSAQVDAVATEAPATVTTYCIAYSLYDSEGKPITIAPYTDGTAAK